MSKRQPRGRKPASVGDQVSAHALAAIGQAQTLAYAPACRLLLETAAQHSGVRDGNEGLAYFGDCVIGLVALDMSLTALRLLAVNDPFAHALRDEPTWTELGVFWGKVRALRDELVYFDERILSGRAPSLVADTNGIHAKNGP